MSRRSPTKKGSFVAGKAVCRPGRVGEERGEEGEGRGAGGCRGARPGAPCGWHEAVSLHHAHAAAAEQSPQCSNAAQCDLAVVYCASKPPKLKSESEWKSTNRFLATATQRRLHKQHGEREHVWADAENAKARQQAVSTR
eukprot:3545827-Pleurochrysis_carterae.AAC.3